MKTNFICLLMLFFLMVAACKKDDPASIPEPQPESVKKYLKKVSVIGKDSLYYEVINCTWDSLYRLKTYNGWPKAYIFNYTFHYDSIGRISRIDYNQGSRLLGDSYYYLCDWKNEKELNGMDFYEQEILDTTAYHHKYRLNYFYNKQGRVEKIENLSTITYYFEWEGLNITKAGVPDNYFFGGNQKFDEKHSPWSVFPDILFIAFAYGNHTYMLGYNPSKNNPIQGGGFFQPGNYGTQKYEYDYDEEGYPIHQYYLLEDGSRLLYYIFEYF